METAAYLGDTELYPRSKYAGELRRELPDSAFALSGSRLALIPAYFAVIATATVIIAKGWVQWEVVPLLSVVIGVCFACLTFVAHETLHGGIVHGHTRQHLVGWLGFLPFVLSPRLWVAWHNRSHHANTSQPDDPDSYPTLEAYRSGPTARFSVDTFSLGGRRWRGIMSLVLGFTVQSADQLRIAKARGFLSRREHRLALLETGLGLAVWATVAALVGFVPFLFVFVLPLLIGNACIMAFILTNHSLSPRLPINDPLVNSLSVTTPRLVELVTLRFGFHVEHHLFPAMSSRHAPAVRALVQARWPERYQSMSIGAALKQLHRTARVYKDATTLVDPTTGREFSTLLPRTSTLEA